MPTIREHSIEKNASVDDLSKQTVDPIFYTGFESLPGLLLVKPQGVAESQVLCESAPQSSETSYFYGLGRISQQKNGIAEYFLTDALGSVRQITNASGSVTYGQAFDPFGSLMSASGLGGGSYGYAGEWTDASGLQSLRAR